MTLRATLGHLSLTLACFAALPPCYALDANDIPKLKVGAVLTLTDPKGETPPRDIAITHVHPVRGDDSDWYQISGTSGSDKEEVLYADLSATPPKLETVIRRINLRKLVDRPRKFLDQVEDEEKGELVMDGVVFQYNDKESDDGVFEPDGDKTKAIDFNYLVFTSTKEARTSIQIMRWDDDKFETYLVKQISASEAKIK